MSATLASALREAKALGEKLSQEETDWLADWDVDQLVLRAFAGGPLTKAEINILLRACLVPAEGMRFACCDYSQVEARALAWAAGDVAAVAVFLSGKDPYAALACRLFAIIVEQFHKKKHAQERDTSKKAELGCGYGMGAPKFTVTAEKGGMVWKPAAECIERQPDWSGVVPCSDPLCGAECEDYRGQRYTHGAKIIVDTWRELHAPIVRFWYALEDAFKRAIRGERVKVGPYEFGPVGKDVWCMLPSGRPIVYREPRIIKDAEGRPRVPYRSPKYEGDAGESDDGSGASWGGWADLYGGKLAENVTQAFCRELLAWSLVRAEERGLPVAFHVHDEIVCEVPCATAYDALRCLEECMKELPPWAEGFPVEAEGHVCKRYRKG